MEAQASAIAPITGCEAIRAEASKYSGWDSNIMAAISEAETLGQGACAVTATGDQSLAYNLHGRLYGYSVSALQVRILPGREHCDAHDLTTNVKCAHDIWQQQGYGAWTKYKTGEYERYLE